MLLDPHQEKKKITCNCCQIILKSFIFPPLAPTNSWKTHRAGLRLPGNVCGCRLPRSCGSRCHRTYTLLAEDFGSPRAQKSSATPSPTPLLLTSAAAERRERRRGEEGAPLTVAHAASYVHTHPHGEAASAASGDCGKQRRCLGECVSECVSE